MLVEKWVILVGFIEMFLGWVIWNLRVMVCIILYIWNIIFIKYRLCNFVWLVLSNFKCFNMVNKWYLM